MIAVERRSGVRLQAVGRRALTLAAVALVLLASSCASPAPADSGVRGRVWLGPLTPVQRQGGPPSERPYAATVEVLQAGGDKVVARTRSGPDGFFEVRLAPGTYVLQGVSPGDLGLPRAAPVTLTVIARRFTSAVVSFDTGIR